MDFIKNNSKKDVGKWLPVHHANRSFVGPNIGQVIFREPVGSIEEEEKSSVFFPVGKLRENSRWDSRRLQHNRDEFVIFSHESDVYEERKNIDFAATAIRKTEENSNTFFGGSFGMNIFEQLAKYGCVRDTKDEMEKEIISKSTNGLVEVDKDSTVLVNGYIEPETVCIVENKKNDYDIEFFLDKALEKQESENSQILVEKLVEDKVSDSEFLIYLRERSKNRKKIYSNGVVDIINKVEGFYSIPIEIIKNIGNQDGLSINVFGMDAKVKNNKQRMTFDIERGCGMVEWAGYFSVLKEPPLLYVHPYTSEKVFWFDANDVHASRSFGVRRYTCPIRLVGGVNRLHSFKKFTDDGSTECQGFQTLPPEPLYGFKAKRKRGRNNVKAHDKVYIGVTNKEKVGSNVLRFRVRMLKEFFRETISFFEKGKIVGYEYFIDNGNKSKSFLHLSSEDALVSGFVGKYPGKNFEEIIPHVSFENEDPILFLDITEASFLRGMRNDIQEYNDEITIKIVLWLEFVF